MSFRFVRDHAGRWPVRPMCRVLEVSPGGHEVSPGGYYGWRSRPESARAAANRALLAEVRRLHSEHRGRYGSPRMHAALRAEGETASRGRVARLMRRHGIRVLADRRFKPCTSDIPTGEGWLYPAAVLDLATRKVVGWAMRDHMRTELPPAALMMAAQRQKKSINKASSSPASSSTPTLNQINSPL